MSERGRTTVEATRPEQPVEDEEVLTDSEVKPALQRLHEGLGHGLGSVRDLHRGRRVSLGARSEEQRQGEDAKCEVAHRRFIL